MANTNTNKRTRTEYVQGKMKFVKVVKPDIMFNCWQATIYPTPDSLEKIREWQGQGLKNTIKKDEDGWFIKFRCDVSKQRKDGTVWAFEAPKVVDKDGKPMDGNLIGDGSDGTLKLEVYEHPTPGGGRAIAARLVGLRVDVLVPVEMTEEDQELVNQPALF